MEPLVNEEPEAPPPGYRPEFSVCFCIIDFTGTNRLSCACYFTLFSPEKDNRSSIVFSFFFPLLLFKVKTISGEILFISGIC